MKPRKLSNILAGQGSDLSRLLQRAERIAGLTGSVRGVLPANIAAHVISASMHDDRMTVIADSAVWAARIRYLDPALSQRLEGLGISADRIQIKVRAPGDEPAG